MRARTRVHETCAILCVPQRVTRTRAADAHSTDTTSFFELVCYTTLGLFLIASKRRRARLKRHGESQFETPRLKIKHVRSGRRETGALVKTGKHWLGRRRARRAVYLTSTPCKTMSYSSSNHSSGRSVKFRDLEAGAGDASGSSLSPPNSRTAQSATRSPTVGATPATTTFARRQH